jgi:hypothetical protein
VVEAEFTRELAPIYWLGMAVEAGAALGRFQADGEVEDKLWQEVAVVAGVVDAHGSFIPNRHPHHPISIFTPN